MFEVKVEALITITSQLNGDTLAFVPLNCAGEIPFPTKHWRDEKAIAAELRRVADRIEQGTGFEGVRVTRNV